MSGCGPASSATGPFYCPLDHTVYLDPGFFRELAVEFKAPGDFAQAYVLAHELGHHVQTLTGITRQVDEARAADPDLSNALSVALELQADCLAGVWGHSTYDRGAARARRPRRGARAPPPRSATTASRGAPSGA